MATGLATHKARAPEGRAGLRGWLALASLIALAACTGLPIERGEAEATPGASPAAPDGVKNGDESDVDCGGARSPKCATGRACKADGDCEFASCKSGTCRAPSPDDGKRNADETDVDCGGANAPKCGEAKSCAKHEDCASDACSYAKKCVAAKTCTGNHGGDTCGAGETGSADAKHESCCTQVEVNADFVIDKYLVTAGRMRTFVERLDGNLKAWAETKPAGWDEAWTPALPSNLDEVHYALGPGEKRGCSVTTQGGRTYWQPPVYGDAAESSDFSKEVLDEKVLNCATWYVAQALCVFDGGRLASSEELATIFENRGSQGGTTTYPWQWKDKSAYNPNVSDDRLVHRYSYQTPDPPKNMRLVNNEYPLDHAFYLAPPGRRPAGANASGVEDAAGNVMPWVSDKPGFFTRTMSWEEHTKKLVPEVWNQPEGPKGYYAIGARCAHAK